MIYHRNVEPIRKAYAARSSNGSYDGHRPTVVPMPWPRRKGSDGSQLELIVERIEPVGDGAAPLADEVEALLDRVLAAVREVVPDEEVSAGFEQWLRTEREQLWRRQYEFREDDKRFGIRMPVAGATAEFPKVVVSPVAIDIVAAGDRLIRHVDFDYPIDESTVTATLSGNELKVNGAKAP